MVSFSLIVAHRSLDLVGELAQDLVEHVAKMLSIHCESVNLLKENGETDSHMLLLPDTVVNGLDLIFNMMTASLDHIVPEEWRDSAEAILVQMRSGVHSLSEKDDLGHIEGNLEEWTEELAKMKAGDANKMDVAHAHAKLKRRVSQRLGASAANEVMGKVGTMPIIRPGGAKEEERGYWGWGKVKNVGRFIGGGHSEPLSPRRKKNGNKDLDEIDNFLESVMAEHGGGYGTAEEDEEDGNEDSDFFDSRL